MLSIISSLSNQNILVTGASGFVGKVVLEKILRSIPAINSIIIFVRSKQGTAAKERMKTEIIESAIFSRLKQQLGIEQFHRLIESKIIPIEADLNLVNMGK